MVPFPTEFLPSIREEPSLEALQASLEALRHIYETRGGQKMGQNEATAQAKKEELQELARDPHERRYTLAWLNKLLASQLDWLAGGMEQSADDSLRNSAAHPASSYGLEADDQSSWRTVNGVLEIAANIFEEIVVAESQGLRLEDEEPIERIFRFPFDYDRTNVAGAEAVGEASIDAEAMNDAHYIDVSLFDAPLTPLEDNREGGSESAASASLQASTAVGMQTWAAAIVLADLLVRDPSWIHSALAVALPRQDPQPLSVAELGAGTGLVGIVCARMLQRQRKSNRLNSPNYEVVLTDYHSLVLDNLKRNADANFGNEDVALSVDLRVEALDWSHFESTHPPQPSAQAHLGRYGLLLAADVVYAQEHPQWLHAAMSALLARSPTSRAHVLNARRKSGRFGEWELVGRTDRAFGPVWAPSSLSSSKSSSISKPRLKVLQRTELPKRKGLGRNDESGYIWWTLGWK